MKRLVIVTAWIVCLMSLTIVGCSTQTESTDTNPVSSIDSLTVSSAAGGEVTPPQTVCSYLPDSTFVEVTKTSITDEYVAICVNATYPDRSAVTRNIRIGNSLKFVSIENEAGQLVAGYALDTTSEGRSRLTVYNGAYASAIETGNGTYGSIRLSVFDGSEEQACDFTSSDEFDLAIEIHDAVQSGTIAFEELSPYEVSLYSKIDNYIAWSAAIQTGDNQRDIDMLVQMTLNRDIGGWLGNVKDPYSPTLDFPRWLGLACKFVSILKQVCTFSGDSLFCEWVVVMEMVCDWLREVFS